MLFDMGGTCVQNLGFDLLEERKILRNTANQNTPTTEAGGEPVKAHGGAQNGRGSTRARREANTKWQGPEGPRPDEAWKTHQGRLAEGFRVQAIGRTVRHGLQRTTGHRGRTRRPVKLNF